MPSEHSAGRPADADPAATKDNVQVPPTDPLLRRQRHRERARRRTAERVALGLCPRCGNGQPAPGRGVCETCADKRRAADRARAAKRREAGIKRIRNPEARNAEYRRARERAEQRFARGVVGHILPLNHQVIASHYLIDESTDAVVYSDTAEGVLR